MLLVIDVKNLSVKYMTGDFKELGLKDYIIKKFNGTYEAKEFFAVNDVSFSLEKGDFLGIIGSNGAGKSTLLKAISGIMQPSEGTLKTEGNIAALLELGTGFDNDMTLRENIALRGAFLGYTEDFIKKMTDDILEFAELKKFENRTYGHLSSGMKSRLAFSISCLVEPDILILDEVLAVGDANFRKKSEQKLFEVIESGATTLLVSHSLAQIRRLCNKVLWLHKGKQIAFGNAKEICDRYEKFLSTGEIDSDSETRKKKNAEKNTVIEIPPYHIGMLLPRSETYGEIIADYALYKASSALGMSVVILDNILPFKNDTAKNFAENNMQLGSVIGLEKSSKNMNNYFESFMLGPGNAWEIHNKENADSVGRFHLNFADISKRTVAYGISYGVNNFEFSAPINKIKYSLLKQRFDYIGLCEDYAVNATKNHFSTECEMVPNPIFLIDRKFYSEIALQSKCRENENYIFVYIVDYAEKYKDYIAWISEKLNMKLVVMVDMNSSINTKKQLKLSYDTVEQNSVADWLYYIENSSFVITDELSCTCLSILYHKNFIALKENYSEKFTLLGNQLGIPNKMVDDTSNTTESILQPYSFEYVDSMIKEYERIGNRFLEKSFIFPRDTLREDTRNQAYMALNSLQQFNATKKQYDTVMKEYGCIKERNSEIKSIQKKLQLFYLDALYKYYDINLSTDEFTDFQYLTGMKKYFSALNNEDYIIIAAVREAAGKYSEKFISMLNLPVTVKPETTDLCVIAADSGNVVFEQAQKQTIRYSMTSAADNLNILVSSYRSNDNSCCAEIIINNINYSMNMKGFNLVIYDKKRKCVADTFQISTCTDEILNIKREK